MLSKIQETVFIIVISLFLGFVFTFPSFLNLNSKYIGDSGDNYEYASYMALANKNINEGRPPFIPTSFWRYPVGFDFSRGFDSYLTVTTGTLFTHFTDLPLGYNLTIIFLITLNGILSFAFFRNLTDSKTLSLIGTIIYGFSFYVIAKSTSHPNLLFIGGFPFFALSFIRILKKDKCGFFDIGLIFASSFLVLLGSLQYFLILILFSITFLSISLIFYPKDTLKLVSKIFSPIKIFTFWTASFIISSSILFQSQISAMLNGTFELSGREGTLYTQTPSPLDYVLPNPYIKTVLSHFISNSTIPSIEKAIFIGFVELLIFFIFFLNPKIKLKFKIFIFILFLIPFALSLGYGQENSFFLLPYRLLSQLFIFKPLAEPARFFTIFYLVISTTIVIAMIPLKKFSTLILLILFLLIAERIPYNYYLVTTFKNEQYLDYVKTDTGTAVLDIPVNPFMPSYNILSFYYKKPIVNGYFHWSADGEKEKSFLTSSGAFNLFCSDSDPILKNKITNKDIENQNTNLIEMLKINDIRTIVIHKDDKLYHPICTNVRERLSTLFPDIDSIENTVTEKQIVDHQDNGKASYSFYFPQSGTFYLDGFYLGGDGINRNNFIVTKNKERVGFSYSWSQISPNSFEINPKYTIQTPILVGDTITISSTKNTQSSYISLWYRFIPANNSPTIPYKSSFTKIYEDESAMVYNLN